MAPHDNGAAHTEATLALAKQEHAEHMEGMEDAKQEMRKTRLIVKAYSLDDPNAPTTGNVKTVHFVRHGQGFHNLMADLAKKAGRTWVQVSLVLVSWMGLLPVLRGLTRLFVPSVSSATVFQNP